MCCKTVVLACISTTICAMRESNSIEDREKGLLVKMDKSLHLDYNEGNFTYVDRSLRIIKMVNPSTVHD